MANLLDNTAFVPSEPAGTSHPSLPSPPFDAGGFLNGLSGAIFGMSPQQVGQGFSDFGSGVQSSLSSFGQDYSEKGFLGTRPGEALFPDVYEVASTAAKPFEVGGPLGGTLEDYAPLAGRGINSALQGVAGATDTENNPAARNLADYVLGMPQALSIVHGAATYNQGLGNLLTKSPDLEGRLGDSFKQGLKGTFEPGISWSTEDSDQAMQKLLATGAEMQSTLFDPQLMRQALYSGFKTNGADDTLAQNAADSLAEPLNFLIQLPFLGAKSAEPIARSLLAQYAASWATDPAKTWDATKQAGGDFFDLLGTTANMTRGGPAPTPEAIDKGLMGLANAVGAVFFGLHVGSKAAGLAARGSYKAAAEVDKPAANSQALVEAHDRIQSSLGDYGTEDLQQTPQAGEAGLPIETGQTPQASAVRAAQTPGWTGEDSGSFAATEEQANQRFQREDLSAPNAQSVSSLAFSGEHAGGVPDSVRKGLEQLLVDKGINHDGWVTTVHFDNTPKEGALAHWDPVTDPHAITVDITRLGESEIHRQVAQLAKNVESAYRIPDVDKTPLADARNVFNALGSRLTPESLVNWITTHEALHSTLGKIYDFPPGGEPLRPSRHSFIAEGVQLIRHMDGTPEGKAWLDFVGDHLGLRGQVDQLRAVSEAVGDAPLDSLYPWMDGLSMKEKQAINEASSHINEALVQAILNHRELAAQPYYFQSGESAYGQSFWNPQARSESDRLAGAYYDAYRNSATSSGSYSPASAEFAGSAIRASRSPADRGSDSAGSDQEGLARTPWDPEKQPLGKRTKGWHSAIQKALSSPKAWLVFENGERRQIVESNHGNMFRSTGSTIHIEGGSHIDIDDVYRVVDDKGHTIYDRDRDNPSAPTEALPADQARLDKLVEFARREGFDDKATPGSIQRALGVGFNEAGRVVDALRGKLSASTEALPADQARLEEARSSWHNELSAAQQRLEDIQTGKRLGNPSLVAQLQTIINNLAHRLDLAQKGGLTVDEIKTEADRLAKEGSPQAAPALPPQRLTPENTQAALQDLQAQRQQAPAGVAKPARVPRQQQLLQEVNSIQPAPQHYTDPRLTDEHRDALAKFAADQMAKGQKLIDDAQAKGDTEAYLERSLQQLATSATWKTFFAERATPNDFTVSSAPKPLNYEAEAARIATLKSPDHFLSPLKDLAGKVSASLENFNRSVAAGMSPLELQSLKTDLQFHMAKFRFAYDLYNSTAFKTGIDKQSYDWRGTRGIARRIDATTISPRDKALMAARMLGEQLKKPYTLQDAARAIKDTSLGLSKEAKNWHPDFKKLLAGEMWRSAKEVYAEDPRLPLGVANIPVHEMPIYEDLRALHSSQQELRQSYDIERKQAQMEIDLARIRERRGQVPTGTTAKMIKDQRQKNLDFSNERARLAALIDNHPESVQSRLVNAPAPTAADLQPTEPVLADPNPDLPNSHLVNQANGLNARIQDPSPDGFSLESFLSEGRDNPVTPTEPLPAWFSPKWGEVLTNLREMGGEHKLLADLAHDLLMKMGDHLDPSRNMWHPKQWFKAHWEAISGIPQRVGQVEERLNNIISKSKDPNFSRSILEAIDDTNDVAQRRAAGQLTEEQANLANFLNEYWRTTRALFTDPALGDKAIISHFIDNYVPHIVLKDPEGKPLYDPKRARWSSRATAAKQRMQDGITHEPIYRTIQSLENQGYTMETNLAKIFSGHANSTFRMMRITEMKNTLGGLIYHSPDGKFVGFPIVSAEDLARMKRSGDPAYKGLEIFDDKKAKVRWGPGDGMFQGFHVHPELAREIEKLAKMEDMPASGLARGLRSLGGIFKFIEFAINPRHAFNVFSNVTNLYSPAGLADVRVFKNVYGRANRALLPEQQGQFFRNVSSRGHAAKVNDLVNQQARIEKEMHDLHRSMQAAGDDPLDPNPYSMTAAVADLRDSFQAKREELIGLHQQLDQALGNRDRGLLASLMEKGLVPDRELIEGADLGGLSNRSEHIPGLSQFHRWMWRDVVWRGQVGIAMHLADQFMMKAASNYGWDGKGGAVVAERFLTPELKDGIQRKAVDYAKQGTALLNKLDMTAGWQLYGRATLLSAPWTLGQLQATRDMMGSNAFTKLLGRGDMRTVSDDMLKSGYGQDEANFINGMHSKLARRMIISGTAKLAMTSFAMQALGTWLYTGQIGNPISNFLRDPDHTFDVYQGKNPATGADMWMANPFFGFQHEMINYALAGVKAAMKGEDPWKVGIAPLVKFTNKNNPFARQLLDVGLGIETGRWLAGMPPGMGEDTDLQNLHRALDTLGVPDFGGVEDRLLYVLRNFPRPPILGTGGFPATAIKRDQDLKPVLDEHGKQIPLTDPKSMLNDFGFGGLINIGSDVIGADTDRLGRDIGQTLISGIGTSQVVGSKPLYDINFSPSNISIQQDPKGYFPQQAKFEAGRQEHEANVQKQEVLVQIGNLAASGKEDSFEQIAQLRDQYGLTDRQVVDAVMYGAYANTDGTSLHSKGLGATSARAGIVTINGQQLTEDQSLQYNKTLNNRQLYAIQELQKDPEFKGADGSTKAMLLTEFMNVAGKFTSAQTAQQLFGTGGPPLTDGQYKEVIQDVTDTRRTVQGALMMTPDYQNASQSAKNQMYQSYLSMGTTLAWNMKYGDLKNIDNQDLQQLVSNSVFTTTQTVDYLRDTPFYQSALPAEQQAMEKEYANLAKQMNINMYNGKARNMQPYALPAYMKSVVNTEETAKYLLHQSDFYQTASLKDQQSLDSKYTTISRNLALKDWSNGKPILNLNQAGQSFSVGPEQVVVGHLMAQQGYTDLQNYFGGAELLNAYAQQETQIRRDIKQNVIAPPATLSRMQKIAVAAFERANPQYSAFKKARTNWERGTSVGRLYLALNADEQLLATVDTASMTDPSAISDDLNEVLDTGTPNISSSGATPEELAIGLSG